MNYHVAEYFVKFTASSYLNLICLLIFNNFATFK
jgi:hypothetical protein